MTSKLLRRFRTDDPERGDVPGWVLITLMTALLVAALFAAAQGKFMELFDRAMSAVTG